MKTEANDTGKTVILKYANRKHYNTQTSKYVTLPEILGLGVDNFVVIDHKTKKDITFKVLVNALYGHFLSNPAAFETVKSAIVEKLVLGAPAPTNN
jgi:polyhydroxyalkanoate synthesis regulator protein